MFPYLSDLLNYIFGSHFHFPIPMFGTMVAVSFIVSNTVFEKEYKRLNQKGILDTWEETIIKGEHFSIKHFVYQFVPMFFIGFKFIGIFTDYKTFSLDPQSFIFSSKGNILGAFILGFLGAGFKYYKMKKEQLENPIKQVQKLSVTKATSKLLLYAIFFGVLGSKVFDLIEHLDMFLENPLQAILSGSGFSIYGGLLFGLLVFYIHCKRKQLNVLAFYDALALTFSLAYGIGRIGCQLSGDGDWGLPNDIPQPAILSFFPEWLWAFDYPNNVLGVDLKTDFESMGLLSITGKAFPTPIYETIMSFITFGALYGLRKKLPVGFLTCIYFMANGVQRFLIEEIRVNIKYSFLGLELSQAQFISLGLITIGIAGFIFLYRKNKA